MALRNEGHLNSNGPTEILRTLGARLLEKVKIARNNNSTITNDEDDNNTSNKNSIKNMPSTKNNMSTKNNAASNDLLLVFPREDPRFALRKHTVLSGRR